MADDSEKRFQSIMNKLFNPASSTREKKTHLLSQSESSSKASREHSLTLSNSILLGSRAPLCRPWDRGDLMRRLTTFKSLTWFGKPKVVSPINCARRGWINVEMDIIACEACGTRLLFSTPLSWTRQQVEKAAAVFSLKLDNGHKLLCPWSDNVCDETLAEFPPIPAPALVESYKDRYQALTSLSSLPAISPSAIDYMRNPQLDDFLAQSSVPVCTLVDGSNALRSKELDNEIEAVSASSYFQALKIISLCGWEPRELPYVVYCEERSTHSAELKESSSTLGEHEADPASVVLDCKLCGASVGLWAFSTVARPLLLFNLVDSPEVHNNQNKSIACDGDDLDKDMLDHNRDTVGTSCGSATVPKERALSLNLTIAGGPPPTKQNFRAAVSLPVISRHLRAGYCSSPEVRNQEISSESCKDQENNNTSEQNEKDHGKNIPIVHEVGSEDARTLKRKRSEDLHSDGRDLNEQGQSSVYAIDTCYDDSDAICTVSNGEVCKENSQDSHGDSSDKPSCLETKGTVENTKIADIEKTEKNSDFQYSADVYVENQDGEGAKKMVLPSSVGNASAAVHESAKDRELVQWDKNMEFDPIRQHRHFCPWISTGSTDTRPPGWQLTLSALNRAKEASSPASPVEFLSTFPIQLDDPVASVRKLFKSPTAKRTKGISRLSI